MQSLQVSSFCVVNSRKMRNSDIIQPYSEALKRAFTIEIQFIIQRKNKSSACRVTRADFGMGGTHGGRLARDLRQNLAVSLISKGCV